MRQTLRNFMTRMTMLVAFFLMMVGTASAQYDFLGTGTKVFSATGTLDGAYTTTFEEAKKVGMPFAQQGTAALIVEDAQYAKVGDVSVSVNGYDVTFTVSGSTATENGAYIISVPENYFRVGYDWMGYDSSAEKFTINLTGMTGGGTVDPGTGGGEGGEGGGEIDPTPSGQPLDVTIDFSKGFVAEKDGIVCASDGQYNSSYGWQVKSGKYVTFTAPYGYLLSKIVLTDSNYGYSLGYTVSVGELDGDTWTGSASEVTFTSTGFSRMTTAAITLVKDADAKAVFADFPSVTPADGSILESITSITLALPEGVAVNALGNTVSVNDNEVSVSATANATEVVITFDKVINAFGATTVVIPQGFVTAEDGSISPATTVNYTINGPFTVTREMLGPNPDVSISLEPDPQFPTYVPGLDAIRIKAPEGVSFVEDFDGVEKSVNVNGRSRKVKVFSYGDQAIISFEMGSGVITNKGKCTITVPANIFATTDGRSNTAFTVTYYLGVPTPAEGDLNEDGVIDGADVEALAAMVLENVDSKTVGKVVELINKLKYQ